MATAEQTERAATRRVGIITAIRDSVRTIHRPPSQSELAAVFGVSKHQIKLDLDLLVAAGAIVREPGVHRGIRVAPPVPTR